MPAAERAVAHAEQGVAGGARRLSPDEGGDPSGGARDGAGRPEPRDLLQPRPALLSHASGRARRSLLLRRGGAGGVGCAHRRRGRDGAGVRLRPERSRCLPAAACRDRPSAGAAVGPVARGGESRGGGDPRRCGRPRLSRPADQAASAVDLGGSSQPRGRGEGAPRRAARRAAHAWPRSRPRSARRSTT